MKTIICFFISALTVTVIITTSHCLAADSAKTTIPDQVTIKRLSTFYEPVEFDHQLHVDYASCVECHHHTTGVVPSNPLCLGCHDGKTRTNDISCSNCHAADPFFTEKDRPYQPKTKFHIDIPGLKAAYHLSCLNCHTAIGAGPTECADCHELTDSGQSFFKTNAGTKPNEKQ